MDFNIVEVISQVGFPIAVCCYLMVVLNKNVKRNTEVLIRISEKMDIDEVKEE